MLVIGDIHGCITQLKILLQSTGITDAQQNWMANQETLVFIGDYTDRGDDGIAVINLVMKLEQAARHAGGHVYSLLGNHDILLLAAHRFGNTPIPKKRPEGAAQSLLEQWHVHAGGRLADLTGLTPQHITWLSSRPAMLQLGNYLFVHADVMAYLEYGQTVEHVNQNLRGILESENILAFDHLDEVFAQRNAFIGMDGEKRARRFLEVYGADTLVHGHTPVAKITRQNPVEVTKALKYADGLCINVDHGLYLGGNGFCLHLE